MEVLLLSDIAGIGRKNDLIVVASGFALNCLLPERKAIVVTPGVRKRYAEQIKQRAVEKEKEREMQKSVAGALVGTIVKIETKASRAGKLYAAISESMIAEAMKAQHSLELPISTISIKEPIKTVGDHVVTITVGKQSTNLTVQVVPESENK